MNSSSPLNGKDIPHGVTTQGLERLKFRPLHLVEIFREEIKIWCKTTGKSREEFCDLVNKPVHWMTKVLSGDWNLAAHDLPIICFVLNSRRLLDAINEHLDWYDAKLRIKLLEDEAVRVVQRAAEIQLEKRQLQRQLTMSGKDN